jgi:hypothetical protein
LITAKDLRWQLSGNRAGSIIWQTAAAIFCTALAAPAVANPLAAPTAQYVADFEITRDSDHSFRVPARYVCAGNRLRIEFVGIVTLIDLNSQQATTMIPRVRTYWAPVALPKPASDARRWIGMEAEFAEAVGTDTLLGRAVTKYRVSGTIFDVRTPFDGYVWTTAENVVLRVEGIGRADGIATPIKMTPVQLVIGPVDSGLLSVPSTFAKAGPSDVGWRQFD